MHGHCTKTKVVRLNLHGKYNPPKRMKPTLSFSAHVKLLNSGESVALRVGPTNGQARCGRPPLLLPSCRKLEFRLSALMDSDLARVNGKSGRQSWRYADGFQRSIISEAIYHFTYSAVSNAAGRWNRQWYHATVRLNSRCQLVKLTTHKLTTMITRCALSACTHE